MTLKLSGYEFQDVFVKLRLRNSVVPGNLFFKIYSIEMSQRDKIRKLPEMTKQLNENDSKECRKNIRKNFHPMCLMQKTVIKRKDQKIFIHK